MDIEGTVYRVLPEVRGQGARGEWIKQEVVFEQPGEFSRKVCVAFWGDKAQDGAALKEGEQVTVSVNLESREHNGRWFTEARAWKVARKGADSVAAQYGSPSYGEPFGAPAPQPAAVPPLPSTAEDVDDLPF